MSMQDTFVIVIILLLFAIVGIVTGIAWDKFNDAIQESDVSDTAKDAISTASTGWPDMMDWLFVSLLFGLPLISMGLSYFNSIPPIFFYASLGLVLLLMLFAWGIQTGWANFIGGGGVAAEYTVSNLPKTNFVMNNLGIYSVLVFIFVAWGVYVKSRDGVGYV